MAGVSFNNVSKNFGNTQVIRDLSFNIEDGEFLVLLGPSGCGKSTIMRMVAGLEQASNGKIFIGEEDVTTTTPQQRNVAMVFQNYSLYPHMTIYKNIGYPLMVTGHSKKKRDPLIRKAAEMAELEHLLDRFPAQLSGGQRQRVAVARAIVRQPRVFLMDEPLSNLDALLRTAMRGQIKNLHYRLGITTIYVTHDQIEAMTLADRIVVLNDGIIQQIGTPHDIYDTPENAFVAGFIGSPPMNLIKGALQQGCFEAEDIKIEGISHTSDEKVILWIRPSEVRLCAPHEADFSCLRIYG
jgi:multiple sugar transport system ATP-binding protein